MKLSLFSTGLLALAQVAFAAPTATTNEDDALARRAEMVRRATITDVADTGYASTNGGTNGGAGGTTTTVSDLAAFTAAVSTKSTDSRVVIVSGEISGSAQVRVGSNVSIIGQAGASLVGVGLYIKDVSNVIVRNMKIGKVLADNGDAIGIQASSNVWVDHCELYSDMGHDKDYYDGLCDITHASEWVTVSNTYFHDHWKASLVGHSDNNGDEDTGHLHVTYHDNYWHSCYSRGPSLRFGTGHVYNSYYLNMTTVIDTRDGAQILVESTVFEDVEEAIFSDYSDDIGYANTDDIVLNGATDTAEEGDLSGSDLPYSYTLLGSGNIVSTIPSTAGAILDF